MFFFNVFFLWFHYVGKKREIFRYDFFMVEFMIFFMMKFMI